MNDPQPRMQFSNEPDLAQTYTDIYRELSELREVFHRAGRLDDSNAKLDEISKLLAVYAAHSRAKIKQHHCLVDPASDVERVIPTLQEALVETAQLPGYQTEDGYSVFGGNPSFSFRPGDESLVLDLLRLVAKAVDSAHVHTELDEPFDILNEAFGHFVRDNFRSNTEDAQYLTPPEVVDFMVGLALTDLRADPSLTRHDRPLVVADPTCGVGSFLTAFYHRVKQESGFDQARLRLVGQDKVERMARLTRINLAMFDVPRTDVWVGNSLSSDSPLAGLNGTVDLVLTNPPFGARHTRQDVDGFGGNNLPLLGGVVPANGWIDSELLFIDRDLALLREGGRLGIVVPDGVVSARGLASVLRQRLKQSVNVLAIVELPPVTFAQAGTRTRTAVLYVQKAARPDPSRKAMLASVASLGYQVRSRKGVQVKALEGENELPVVLGAYGEMRSSTSTVEKSVLRDAPSVVAIQQSELVDGSWTPNHHSAAGLRVVEELTRAKDVVPKPLKEIALVDSGRRRSARWEPGSAFISVLHVVGEGLLDLSGIQDYAPKTPGYRVQAGEVLISRINPRIPRAIVVPPLADRILCSAEFEVIVPKREVDSYALLYLLLTEAVQRQIRSLTSGTSASHNRVKSEALGNVLIPLPREGSGAEEQFELVVSEYGRNIELMYQAAKEIWDARRREGELFDTLVDGRPATNVVEGRN